MLPKLLAPATLAERPDIVTRVREMILGTKPEGAAAALRGMAENDFGVDTSLEQVMRLMVPFLAAGMRAESGVSDEALATAQFKPRTKTVTAKAG